MKSCRWETTESRILKNQLPTAHLVLVGESLDVRAKLKKLNTQLQSVSFVLKLIIYSNFGKWRIFQRQHSGHQMNRNGKITSKVPSDETQREDSLWNSLSERTTEPHLLTGDNTRYIYNRYSRFIHEFIQIGHIKEVPRYRLEITAKYCFSFPCHWFIKEASRTPKLKVVFDASAKSAKWSFFKRPSDGWTSISNGFVWNSDLLSVSSSSTVCRHCQDVSTSSNWRWRKRFPHGFVGKFKRQRNENLENDKSDFWSSIIFAPLN